MVTADVQQYIKWRWTRIHQNFLYGVGGIVDEKILRIYLLETCLVTSGEPLWPYPGLRSLAEDKGDC